MTKKWLYSVALGALLIAGEAMGITVHDVLSNGFFSSEIREAESHLRRTTDYFTTYKKEKTTQDEDGNERKSGILIDRSYVVNHMRWKNKEYFISWENKDGTVRGREAKSKLTLHSPFHREKNIKDSRRQMHYDNNGYWSDTCYEEAIIYNGKPCKKDARPMGPYVVDDWFPDVMMSDDYGTQKSCFFGTEHNAVTNVISDNEAYITGTISQTGHVDEALSTKANVDASLLRTYTQHITTDADHVYVEQEITENAQNAPQCNLQATWQTQYTATFKKGRWKGETETISQVSNSQLADWFLKKVAQNSR